MVYLFLLIPHFYVLPLIPYNINLALVSRDYARNRLFCLFLMASILLFIRMDCFLFLCRLLLLACCACLWNLRLFVLELLGVCGILSSRVAFLLLGIFGLLLVYRLILFLFQLWILEFVGKQINHEDCRLFEVRCGAGNLSCHRSLQILL